MLDQKTIRKLLMTAVAVALATMPVAAESPAQDCYVGPTYGGLFCNDGSDIEVCDYGNEGCWANCGLVEVEVSC